MDDDGVAVEVEVVGEINMTRLVYVGGGWSRGRRVGVLGMMILQRGNYESPSRISRHGQEDDHRGRVGLRRCGWTGQSCCKEAREDSVRGSR